MRVPGFGPRRPVPADAGGGRVIERRPGESVEAFETRRAIYEQERAVAEAAERARREAYAEGRRDQHRLEKQARRPGAAAVLTGVVLVAAAGVGAVWLALAAQEGSFAAGGAVVDRTVAEISAPARVAATQAADRTGAAVQTAGQALETSGERLRQTPQ